MSVASDNFVAELLSAATGQKVHTQENMQKLTKNDNLMPAVSINLDSSHKVLLMRGPVSSICESPNKIDITVKTLSGTTASVSCSPRETLGGLVKLLGIQPNQQTLLRGGKQLSGNSPLASYNIGHKDVLLLGTQTSGGTESIVYLDSSFRSPAYDYDFTNITDVGCEFKRGGFVYKRPIGTNRIALNVLNRYGDNTWLEEGDKAWPVSYHGTGRHNLESIAEHGYLLSKGVTFRFGRGIYSTPDLATAMCYADLFTYQNKTYKFIIQNRVNPNTMERISKTRTGLGEYWVSENDRDVRPYGICYKQC